MTKKKHSEYKIAVFGAIIGVFFTGIYDLIKALPILSTLWNTLKWIWVTIFKYEISVWQIIIALICISILTALFKARNNNESEKSSQWLKYTEDTFENLTWKWSWRNNGFNVYIIKDLKPVCPKCGTSMSLVDVYHTVAARCPRCDHHISELKDPEKITHIIHDNIDRNLYQIQE